MSKYRAFLTPEEAAQFDEVVRQQSEHRKALRDLRPSYLNLVWRARDRAKGRHATRDPAENAHFWADQFRTAAAEMPAEAPADIDPILWNAQREAYLAQAAELEGQFHAIQGEK